MLKSLFIVGILFFTCASFSQSVYTPLPDRMCDGYPQIQVGSFEGSCVGLVVDSKIKDSKGRSLQFPRKIIQWKTNQFLITDMGSWDPYQGKVWLLDVTQPTSPKLQLLLDKLVLPHGIAIGPDGWVYVGEMGLIFKFNPEAADKASSCKIVVGGLQSTVQRTKLNPCKDQKFLNPTNKIIHPLVNFVFSKSQATESYGPMWNLIVNQGAVTEHCEKYIEKDGKCLDNSGLVKEFRYLGLKNGDAQWSQVGSTVASGLRNSMGLVSHRSGTLIQFENSRDFPEAEEPHEELNILVRGKHYGWPYCYNFQGKSPEWAKLNNFPCDSSNSQYQAPFTLLPPHVAPLDAFYYEGELFPELQNHLLVGFHGYREAGQKIAAYLVDSTGVPVLSAAPFVYSSFDDKLNTFLQKEFSAKGGILQHSSFKELVFQWNSVRGKRPKGAPVGLTAAYDGSIWIIEDKNKSILRISKGQSFLEESSLDVPAPELKLTAESRDHWNILSKEIFSQKCASCHGQFQNPNSLQTLNMLVDLRWIVPGDPTSLLIQRLKGVGGATMPLGGSLTKEQIQSIEQFILDLD